MIEPSSVKISAFDGNLVDKLQAVSGQAQAIKKQRQVWSLTKFYSVDFLPSRIGVKKERFQQTHDQDNSAPAVLDFRALRGTPDSVLFFCSS